MAIAAGISREPGTLMRSISAPRCLEHFHSTGKERIGDVVVVARLDDQDTRTLGVAILTLASPRPRHRCAPIEA
jgi:hypothetical protein